MNAQNPSRGNQLLSVISLGANGRATFNPQLFREPSVRLKGLQLVRAFRKDVCLILKVPDVMPHIKIWSVFVALLVSITICSAARRPPVIYPEPELKWADPVETGGAITAAPALSDDGLTLYVGSADKHFYAINTDDGTVKWVRRLPAAINDAATIDDEGTIYVPCANGALYALIDEGDTNSFKWVQIIDGVERVRPFRAQRPGLTSPVVTDDGTIYIGSTDNRLYALSSDGAVLDGWPLIAPNDVGTPVVQTTDDDGEGDTIYFISGGKLYGVSLEGDEQSVFAPGTAIRSIPAVGNDGSIFFGADNERVYALYSGGTSNDLRWRFNTGENVSSSPVIGVNGDIYIGSESARVYSLNTNGLLNWSVTLKKPVHSALSIGADGTIYAGSDDKSMYAISSEGTIRWAQPTGGRVRSAAVIDSEGTVYFGSSDKKIYAVYDDAPSLSGENVWPMFRRDRYHSARATEGSPFLTQEPRGANGTNIPANVISEILRSGTTDFVVTDGATSLTVTNGDNVLVSVIARAGSPVRYQWRLDGENINPASNRSATNATLVLTNIQPDDAGVYSVAVENDFDIAYSDEFRLTVISPPVLTVTLTNQFLLAGGTISLNVGAQGTPPLFYQWFTNGVPITGATNATLIITNAQPSDSAMYSVTVMNANGSVSNTPITVTVFPATLTLADHPLGAGPRHSLAVLTNGTLWTWGLNNFGQLGNNVNNSSATNFSSTPQLVGTNGAANTNAVWANVAAGGRGADVSTNQFGGFSLGIQTNGTLWAWGANHVGQLGLGSTNAHFVPTRVGVDSNWFQVEGGATHTLALRRDGSLWAWGANNVGQLGIGSTNSFSLPIRVGTDSAWVEIRAGGFFSLARRADGTIWAWGANTNGQLGIGVSTNRSSPTMIGTDSDWAGISAGVSHSLAVKTNGTLWAWGLNNFGQLGSGSGTLFQTNRPMQIGPDTDWSLPEAGSFHSFGIKAGGGLFAWGANEFGQLGNGQSGSDENRFSPTQIAPSETWRAIDASTHSLGMTTDGRVFAWGWNSHGQVGNGNTNNQAGPVLLNFIAGTNSVSTNNTSTNNVSTNPPSITQQPVDRLINEGTSTSFSVIATGAPPLSYQWYFGSNVIPTATNASSTAATLLLINAQGGTANGQYSVVVSNVLGSVTSRIATLTITNTNGVVFLPNANGSSGVPITNSAPFITQQPTNQNALTNSVVRFSVVADGAMTLFYQWRFNSNAIDAAFNVTADTATTATLTLSNLVVTNSGFYDVVITNNLGSITSAPVQLTVTNGVNSPPGPGAVNNAKTAAHELRLGRITIGTQGVAIEVRGAPDEKKLVLEYKESLGGLEWRPISTNDSSAVKLYDGTQPVEQSRFYRVRVE